MTCPCVFYENDPAAHVMVAFETLAPAEAARLIAELTIDETISLFADYTTDFMRFVAQHNWSDPVAMAEMADYASDVGPRADRGRTARMRVAS